MRTGISWLDVKLGLRMLVKHPGLTLVGGLGMAVAIAIGAGSFAFFYSHMYPAIPLDEGDRLVALENWNTRLNNEERQSLHDFDTWRTEMRTVRDVGAFRTVGRNLIVPGRPAEPVPIAEITAAGFHAARVAPLLGRPLVDEDEAEGAPPVVVIGYDAWRTRFAGDRAIVGRTVRLGNTVHTVVGVMPDGFGFPVSHDFWTPLRARPAAFERGKGPEIYIFGRLAPGATREQAQAELTALGQRAAAAYPRTHRDLRPQVLPYTYPITDIQDVSLFQVSLMQLMVSVLLVVVAVNVAVLVYARTATRMGELAVRTALGASRRRIVTQLFAEALVLAALAAAAGLALAQLGLRQANAIMEQETGVPFWTDYSLSSATVLYVVALAVLAAVIVGVLPALQATGRRLQSSLRQMGGGTGMRLGRTWTVLIVVQVAIAVAALPMAAGMGWSQIRQATVAPTYPAEQLLTGYLVLDREPPPGADAQAYGRAAAARFPAVRAELLRRVQAEPGVAFATYAAGPPGGETDAAIAVEGMPGSRQVRFGVVDAGYFETLGVPVLAGRPFHAGDLDSAATAVIVNRTFVQKVLGGGNPLGRRFHYAANGVEAEAEDAVPEVADPARRYEIVGVVADLLASPVDAGLAVPTLYHPVAPGKGEAVILVRVQGTTPSALMGRLREITTEVDPTLWLSRLRAMDTVNRQEKVAVRLVALVLGLITLSVLLLSAGGIYALMSFTVTRRRREIGIRSALGADPRRILASIFSRAVRQLAIGLAVGVAAAGLLDVSTGGEMMGGAGMVLLPAVAVIMSVVGLLAAFGPARRGLRIQPMEALREE